MKVVSIGEKLAMAREAQYPKVTQQRVAELLGISRSTYANYEVGLSTPPEHIIATLAGHWGIPFDWFVDGEDSPVPRKSRHGRDELPLTMVDDSAGIRLRYVLGATVALPVWRGALAGGGQEMSFVEGSNPELQEVPAFLLNGPAEDHRIVEVAGGSMAPRIQHSDKVIVRIDDRPPLHTLVVVKSPDQQMFIKVLRPAEPPLPYELHPLAERYPIIKGVSGWEFVGSVVAILKSAPPGEPNIEWNGGAPLKG